MNGASTTLTRPLVSPSQARASRNGSFPARAAGVEVRHDAVPGRLRLLVPALRHAPDQARRLQSQAAGWPGVQRATASPVTGSLLLEFDSASVAPDQLVAHVGAFSESAPSLDELTRAERRAGSRTGRRGRASASVEERDGIGILQEMPPVPPPPPRQTRRLEAALGAAAVVGAGAMLLGIRAHGHNLAVDQAPLALMEAVHSDPLTAVMRFASRLIDPPVIIPVTAAATMLGVGRRHREDLPWLAPTAVAGGAVLIHGLKAVLGRARPSAFAHLTRAPGSSLPSGHAFLAMCLYGLLAHHGLRWLRARRPDDRRAAALLLTAAATTVLLVGVSRVYLGVHYPTDVIAGYVLALLWLWLLAAINDRTPVRTAAEVG
jgi:undecaprenyl-diphosphatase